MSTPKASPLRIISSECDIYFDSIDMIVMKEIKLYYLNVLKIIQKEDWNQIYSYFKEINEKIYASNIKFLTKDAHTLMSGPAIYLADDVSKIAKFCIQQANIPDKMMETMKIERSLLLVQT